MKSRLWSIFYNLRQIKTKWKNKTKYFLNNHFILPKTFSDSEMWERTNQIPVDKEILQRRWRWLGHSLRKPPSNITRQALTWIPPGKRKWGRPCHSWRSVLETDVKSKGKNWKELEKTAQDRVVWRQIVGGLCPRKGKRLKERYTSSQQDLTNWCHMQCL